MQRYLIIFTLFLYGCSPKQNPQSIPVEPNEKLEKVSGTDDGNVTSWHNASIEQIEATGYHAAFVPGGRQIIYTSSNYEGLHLYDLEKKMNRNLTNARGAGYQPVVDENSVFFRVKDKTESYQQMDLDSNSSSPIRNMPAPSGLSVKLNKDLSGLEIYNGDQKTKTIAPGEYGSYLFPSLSPDGSRILFDVSGRGGFISDLEGKIVHELGELDQPSWVSDHEVVYSVITDDGMQTISGEIYIKDLRNDEIFQLSKNYEGILMSPSPSSDGTRIIANTPDGQLVIITKK